jgi:hypothetical protein
MNLLLICKQDKIDHKHLYHSHKVHLYHKHYQIKDLDNNH